MAVSPPRCPVTVRYFLSHSEGLSSAAEVNITLDRGPPLRAAPCTYPRPFFLPSHSTLTPPQEERGRLHAEMARMQSLEEEALMKGTLSAQASTASSSNIGAFGRVGGGAEAAAGAGTGAAKQSSGDGDEPQTDEEEAYSDQARPYTRTRSEYRLYISTRSLQTSCFWTKISMSRLGEVSLQKKTICYKRATQK